MVVLGGGGGGRGCCKEKSANEIRENVAEGL